MGTFSAMIWDQSADRLRFNDNAELILEPIVILEFIDNVDTFLYFNDRDLYFVDKILRRQH